MDELQRPTDVRRRVDATRCAGGSIGLVPTMGYLHQGHLALARRARAENDLVVLSSYVNPTQFGPHEDFARYPRDPARDRELAAGVGVDVLFAPSDDTMYPRGVAAQQVWIDPGEPGAHFEGVARPGHFRGVATVVAKLLHLVQPDRAYFGQKDGQQAAVVGRMILDLAWPVELHILPTVRESDGLAMSSRNVFLNDTQRSEAAALSGALLEARDLVLAGERDASAVKATIIDFLSKNAPNGRIDYVDVAELTTMTPIASTIEEDAIILLAVFFGSTRLIDNGMIRFDAGRPHWS